MRISDGTIEGMKWLALALMTGDHVNKYLFHAAIGPLFDAGRIAAPIFIFVLAFNLARPGGLETGRHKRIMGRLVIFGGLASPAFVGLGGLGWGWWPANIMFALLVITACVYLIERGTLLAYVGAGLVFLVGGAVVEFWWPAVAFGLAVWWHCRRPGLLPLSTALIALAAFWIINRNAWAVAVVPLLIAARHVDLRVPRARWAFYVYYPTHLTVLWLVNATGLAVS